MEGGDPDSSIHSSKRPRLDSVNSVSQAHPPLPYNHPLPPTHAQPTRHPAGQTSPPSTTRPRPPPHSLPPPQSFPPPGPYHGPSPSPSLPHSDLRAYSDPRNIPSPGQRPHGGTGPAVTLPARNVSQDTIGSYHPVNPQSTAPEPQSSRVPAVDAKPAMEHGQPWPEHRNGSVSNGYPVISPPHDAPYPPPSMAASPHPQQHFAGTVAPSVSTYPSSSYMSPAAQFGQQHMRRKQVRATQACNNCRQRKQKCDEQRPCQFCREQNYDCQYKDVPPPKQDRTMMQLQDSVNMIGDTLKDFIANFAAWKEHMEQRLPPDANGTWPMSPPMPRQSFGEHSASRIPTPAQGRAQPYRFGSIKAESSPKATAPRMSPGGIQAATPARHDYVLSQQPATPADSTRADHEGRDPETGERIGLLADHTTPAHQLLEDWPSMQQFTQGIPYLKKLTEGGRKKSEYPLMLERGRGIIRVYGRGEGIDVNDGAQGPGSPDSQDADAPSPAVKDSVWGDATTFSGAITDAHQGGLNPDGSLKLDRLTAEELTRSYLNHMHTLHPFIDPGKLREMVGHLVESYNADSQRSFSPNSAMHTGTKRKRSTSAFQHHSPSDEYDSGERPLAKSLRNALVLLVFAIGKVCAHRGPLPAPVGDRDAFSNNNSSNNPSPFSSGVEAGSHDDPRQRNIDMLPGMAYFSYATDILGNHQGGNTIGHAQANLLAALYVGQFARVLESWSWINNACRVCLILVKADLDKISRKSFFDPTVSKPSLKEGFRLNLVKCVYWTCLQLESDILAELSALPPSGISKYQAEIAYPFGVFDSVEGKNYDENSEHEKIMYFYSTQIHLRVILNDAHNNLYKSKDHKQGRKDGALPFDTNNLKEVANQARVHADILASWRTLLAKAHSWDDGDPPSTDLNIARLRAKFYGGNYMILRPFLFLAVHEIELPPGLANSTRSSGASSSTASSPAVVESGGTPVMSERHMIDISSEQQKIIDVAIQCVESAIQSTIAFDRVGADPNERYTPYADTAKIRLIVPNIFGTLHAQFGNMLVLAAVSKSRLKTHIGTKLKGSVLSALFNRTIKILESVAPNSPILRMDVTILKNVMRQNGIGE